MQETLEMAIATLPPPAHTTTGAAGTKGQIIEGSLRALHPKEFMNWLHKQIVLPLLDQLQRATDIQAIMADIFEVIMHPERQKEGNAISYISSVADKETLDSLRSQAT